MRRSAQKPLVTDLRLIDVIEPLAEMAAEVLNDPYVRGPQFLRARTVVVAEPGARVDLSRAIVVGKNMRGRVRDGSFVVDIGQHSAFDARDSVIVGNGTRVIDRGNNVVKGRRTRVFTSRRLEPSKKTRRAKKAAHLAVAARSPKKSSP